MSANVPPPIASGSAGVAAAPAKGKSNTWLYVLLGCGGCLAVGGVVGVALLVVGGFATRRAAVRVQSAGTGIVLAEEQSILAVYLHDDTARSERLESTFKKLTENANSGTLKMADVIPLQTAISEATSDDKLTADEADAILDQAEKLTR